MCVCLAAWLCAATAHGGVVCVAALGEAVGLLMVNGTSAVVWVISTAVLLFFCAILGVVWYILNTYVARRGEFGLRYFLGAADSGAPDKTSGTQVQYQHALSPLSLLCVLMNW